MYTLKVVSDPAFSNISINVSNIHNAVANIPNLTVEFSNYPQLGSYEAQILNANLQIFPTGEIDADGDELHYGYNSANSSLLLPVIFIPGVGILSLFDFLDPEDNFQIRDIYELSTAFRNLMIENGINPNATAPTDEPVDPLENNTEPEPDNNTNTDTDPGDNNNNNQDGGDGGNKTMMFVGAAFIGFILLNSN